MVMPFSSAASRAPVTGAPLLFGPSPEAIRTKLILEVASRTPEHRIVPVAGKERLSRRMGVDRNGCGNGSRLDNGILRAFDDAARWHLHSGWPGGENRCAAFSDIGRIVPFECDTIGCRRRVHLQRTIIRLIYRYDELP
jgi:hypothetical protein